MKDREERAVLGDRKCPNCGQALRFMKREDLQLGRTGWILGDLPNLFAGALDAEIWACPDCGKLEFYLARPEEAEGSGIARMKCPACGRSYEMDSPKCPHCGAKNENW